MNEFKGTKGKWRLESDEWSDYIISDSPEPPHHGTVICGMDRGNENFEHDAKLIASAPDLLDILTRIVEHGNRISDLKVGTGEIVDHAKKSEELHEEAKLIIGKITE